ncbi:MAG: hypothetical protein AAF938_09240 [Myxococcota bacterium]
MMLSLRLLIPVACCAFAQTAQADEPLIPHDADVRAMTALECDGRSRPVVYESLDVRCEGRRLPCQVVASWTTTGPGGFEMRIPLVDVQVLEGPEGLALSELDPASGREIAPGSASGTRASMLRYNLGAGEEARIRVSGVAYGVQGRRRHEFGSPADYRHVVLRDRGRRYRLYLGFADEVRVEGWDDRVSTDSPVNLIHDEPAPLRRSGGLLLTGYRWWPVNTSRDDFRLGGELGWEFALFPALFWSTSLSVDGARVGAFTMVEAALPIFFGAFMMGLGAGAGADVEYDGAKVRPTLRIQFFLQTAVAALVITPIYSPGRSRVNVGLRLSL